MFIKPYKFINFYIFAELYIFLNKNSEFLIHIPFISCTERSVSGGGGGDSPLQGPGAATEGDVRLEDGEGAPQMGAAS